MVMAVRLEELLAEVVDPEIPVLTIADLGMVRSISEDDDGGITVTITPTYSGCPALGVIEEDIVAVMTKAGYDRVTVNTVFSPAWTTDWMTEDAKRKLKDYGIAPPGAVEAEPAPVLCPRCSGSAKLVSEFGSTACKALMVCTSCGEPFDHFKAI
jgi:ring-1,2-phenylacetyl-CoA epoxidase subunit PaaD